MQIFENAEVKAVRSPEYNSLFNKKSGFFARWGKTETDDPDFCPFGPEILDIEVTTICGGVRGLDGRESPCRFCYKSNTPNGKNMSFETFKAILDKFPKVDGHLILNQIAFGADAHATSNPDLWQMMEYCRSVGVIPNITVADITDETADKLAHYCGAVAVSRYANKDLCYDSVKRLVDRGMTQVNIHIMVSAETEGMVWETFRDRLTDPRLEKLNAIVLLSLKKKGRGRTFTQLPFEKFKAIVDFALANNIGVGFDSCGCHKFLASVKDHPDFKRFLTVSEPCESSCFSYFVNVDGCGFPCSFAEGAEGWENGLVITACNDFVAEIWNNERMLLFRQNLLNSQRNCFLYTV